jgi:hypothetical protein
MAVRLDVASVFTTVTNKKEDNSHSPKKVNLEKTAVTPSPPRKPMEKHKGNPKKRENMSKYSDSELRDAFWLSLDQECPVNYPALSKEAWIHVCQKDAGMAQIMRANVRQQAVQRNDNVKWAYKAMGKTPTEVFIETFWLMTNDFKPPMFKKSNKETTVAFEPPSEHFTTMAKELIHVLRAFFMSLDARGMAPIHYNWKFHLTKACNMLDNSNIAEHLLMHIVCIMLASATYEESCITSTAALKTEGLLTIEKLAEAAPEDHWKLWNPPPRTGHH